MDVSEDSSSNVGTYDYDVFLSFNGFGFRHVADELCRSLKVVGIRVFKGEELGGGEDIASSLCKAIKRSRISIPIFSSDYARNAQCLDEVVQMLECRESQGHRIFPIYSFVDPHVVRNQMGPFRHRLTEHVRGGIDLDRIEIWKKALRQVACLKGWEVCSLHDYDPTHIVSYVLQSLKEYSSSSVTMGVSRVSSLVQGIRVYDVFLNFGPHVKRDFADLLYRRLKDAGVLVFRGEDIAVGEEMVDFTQQVIKRSRISIPVFSTGYAKSRQCLDEVSGMVECRKSQGHRVFPIYYQIDPDKIRYHLTDSGYTHQGEDPDRMEMWKRALREVTSLKGWKFDLGSDYDKCIERIISHVLQSLREDITSITMDVPVGSSLVKGTYDYDVFLSFGSDIGRDFADPFYHRLKNARILIYRGEDIPMGEKIAGFALQVMKRSKISIPIFSKGYARSEQCLDEVVGMLDCRKSQGHRVFPIYYEIDPEDIRNQMGEFTSTFSIHDEEVDHGRIEIWEQALREVASLKGWELDDEFQAGDIEHIISYVLQSLKELDSSSTVDVSEGSSDLVDRIPGYNVFLNFGSDTRRGFSNLLYRRLKDAGVLVFRGEDIAVGEEMVDFTQQVIKRSRISIPVFSGDYARSEQCLDEVVGMLECRKSQGHRVFPIYYEIDPQDIRNQIRDKEVDPGRIEIWERALCEVTSLKGWELDERFQAGDIEHIISYVLQSLKELDSSSTVDVSEGSSDLVDRIPGYNVFLNFGSDTRRGFADLLYRRLKGAGALVFRGEDIAVGEEMVDFTQQVIKRSRISIPVFSRDYAESRQCLDEVSGMVECRKSQGHRVFPIYYQIDPDKIRYQLTDSGYTHQGVDPDRMEMWKQALREVTSLKGWKFDQRSGYDERIKHIVSHVLQSLREDITSITMEVPVGSSLVKGTYDYDVFLSFESDTERNFAATLYHKLKDARILVYRGKDIPVGEDTTRNFSFTDISIGR